jgi:uncharacterized membrane protein (Fun14 family)
MVIESFSPIATSIGGCFFAGVLVGWTLKKVMRLTAVILGLFLVGLAYLQYQHIAFINWDKLEQASEGVVNTLLNATTNGGNLVIAESAITNLGIPLTSSISIGFVIGFIRG